MNLPAIRRLPAGEARLEHGLGVGARAAGNRRIDDLNARVLLLIDVEHGVEPFLLAAVGPPAEDLEFAAGCSRRCGGGLSHSGWRGGCWRGGGLSHSGWRGSRWRGGGLSHSG